MSAEGCSAAERPACHRSSEGAARAQAKCWWARSACFSWTRSPPAWTRRPRTRWSACCATWRTWRACVPASACLLLIPVAGLSTATVHTAQCAPCTPLCLVLCLSVLLQPDTTGHRAGMEAGDVLLSGLLGLNTLPTETEWSCSVRWRALGLFACGEARQADGACCAGDGAGRAAAAGAGDVCAVR